MKMTRGLVSAALVVGVSVAVGCSSGEKKMDPEVKADVQTVINEAAKVAIDEAGKVAEAAIEKQIEK